ncbi:hypothetical protein HanXRQr2_Chr02g0076871 [Helianthus annuus]|uniref:Uncharacterized protein n=1 Tax=Helianthus annuus TaxID=4232 RepID=A0A251VBC9_HELAN|nr:hypothetical protein HanXRQr2_Chr02g0076871 [Helianthus annuus]
MMAYSEGLTNTEGTVDVRQEYQNIDNRRFTHISSWQLLRNHPQRNQLCIRMPTPTVQGLMISLVI